MTQALEGGLIGPVSPIGPRSNARAGLQEHSVAVELLNRVTGSMEHSFPAKHLQVWLPEEVQPIGLIQPLQGSHLNHALVGLSGVGDSPIHAVTPGDELTQQVPESLWTIRSHM